MSFLLEVAKLADWDVNSLIVGSGPAALIAFTQVRQQGAEVLAICGGRTCVTYVNSLSPVRGIVFVQYQVLAPPGPRSQARACRPREGVRPGDGWCAGRLAGARAGAGKAAGGGGKARGRTVINSAAVSDGMRGNW